MTNAPFSSARQSGADMNSPIETLNGKPCCVRSTQSVTEVSDFSVPVSAAVLQSLSDAELSRHQADCRFLASLARARFRGSHNPADKAEADRWSELETQAIKDRQDAYEAFDGPWATALARRNG